VQSIPEGRRKGRQTTHGELVPPARCGAEAYRASCSALGAQLSADLGLAALGFQSCAGARVPRYRSRGCLRHSPESAAPVCFTRQWGQHDRESLLHGKRGWLSRVLGEMTASRVKSDASRGSVIIPGAGSELSGKRGVADPPRDSRGLNPS